MQRCYRKIIVTPFNERRAAERAHKQRELASAITSLRRASPLYRR